MCFLSEQQFLVHYIDLPNNVDDYWIGLNHRDAMNTFVWAAGDDPGFTWSGGAAGSATPAGTYM